MTTKTRITGTRDEIKKEIPPPSLTSYPHLFRDAYWQALWEENRVFQAINGSSKPKYYALDMFPYPSSLGLHMGHVAAYTPADIVSRYKMAKGFNVLHPMGYDAFGLPAEQYAITTGVHPAITTQEAIENFRRQLKSFGFCFDWNREISTCDPNFYKWTQFLFTKLYEKGLAYQKEAPVNWCPALRTVLANEEVVDGKSERGGHPVIRLPMKQWMLRITDYAERLLQDLDKLDWPERTKEGQRNWIGKSQGAEVQFGSLNVYTTRPDTIFGVTFMALAPEHPMVTEILSSLDEGKTEILKALALYVKKSLGKSEVDRKASTEKTGVFTGTYLPHPLTLKPIPVWVADYVLMDYGTGAIMGVPGHDERDRDFALQYNLPIIQVFKEEKDRDPQESLIVDSDFLNGLTQGAAIPLIIKELENRGLGRGRTQYKLRDWLFSRQRYWGEPFPVVYMSDGSLHTLPLNELPILLPEVADYEPSESGEAPLARVKDWVQWKNKEGTQEGRRETDTMPGSAGSSWYFLRYTDPQNPQLPFSFEAQKYWMPVDLYVGGAEHTVGHLLYARFWQKVFFDIGLTSYDEPFQKLYHQGMILGSDGEKMSKSRGNGVNPDEVKTLFGADVLRTYLCFLGPVDRDKPWNTQGIEGVKRFLDRVWRLFFDDQGRMLTFQTQEPSEKIIRHLHKLIRKVGEDIETLNLNTAISAMMIFVNELYKETDKKNSGPPLSILKPLLQLLAPFAPHMCEELWFHVNNPYLNQDPKQDLKQDLNQEYAFISQFPWPTYNPDWTADDLVTIAVQVNGKTRGTILVSPEAEETQALAMALKLEPVSAVLSTQKPGKIIYKPGRILNLVCTGGKNDDRP